MRMKKMQSIVFDVLLRLCNVKLTNIALNVERV